MPPATVSAIDQRRLEKLAAEAGSTPKAMLKHVLRNGFDHCEHVVRAVNQGFDNAREGRTVSATEVRRKARDTIARHAAKAKTVEATVAMWNNLNSKRGSFSDEYSTL